MIGDIRTREEVRIARIRAQMKEQDNRRYTDADRDDELSRVWVVYAWTTPVPKAALARVRYSAQSLHDATQGKVVPEGMWMLAGFRRRRNRRKPQTMRRFFAKVRRRLGLDKETAVLLLDLQTARLMALRADQSWLFEPPRRQVSLRPAAIMMQDISKPPKRKVTRYRKSVAPIFHKKTTPFIALGRNSWDREPGYIYLGSLAADTRKQAEREAATTFCVYNDIQIVPVAALSKRLRNAMHKARTVRPGITRLQWPEPVALDVLLAAPAREAARVTRVDVLHHVNEQEKIARRHAKKWSDKKSIAKLTQALSVCSFLYELPAYPDHGAA